MSTPEMKVAVITGASQGIGAGLVDAYRNLGYAVVATSRSTAPSQDPDVVTVQGDIAEPATAERVASAAIERFGRIDTLVDNAGIFVAKPFHEYTQADYDAVTGVNLVPGWPCARDTVGPGSALPVTWRVTCHLDR